MKYSAAGFLVLCLALSALHAEDTRGMPPPPPQNIVQARESRERMDRDFEEILSKMPEEQAAQLRKLKEENPIQFRKALFEYFENLRKADFEKVRSLREAYLKAETDAEKATALQNLRTEIANQIHRNLENSERHLKRGREQLELAQKRLDAFQKEYEERKLHAEDAIEHALKDLTNPDFELKEPPSPPMRHARKKGEKELPAPLPAKQK